MAKGKATGLWKGKVGNNVFYKITNSNNAQKQGIRERVIEVSNPKTTAQAGQRYKLLPAQRIAGALKEIIERGQQGVKYGALSRNEFMSRALKMTTGFPYMEKDDPNTIPGEYQLTKGTLPEVVVFKTVNTDFASGLKQIDGAVGNATNFGEACSALIAANPFLQDGDQLTLVAFAATNGHVISSYESIVLDVDSTSTEDDYKFFLGIPTKSLAAFGSEDDSSNILIVGNSQMLGENDAIIAAAVIISRPNGANGYLRSNATLFVDKTNAAIAKYFSTTGRSDALKTYEGDTSVTNNTNWPVDIDGDGGASGGGGSAVQRGLYTLTAADLTAANAAAAGSQILVGSENGVITKIYYGQSEDDDNPQHFYCVDLSGDAVTYQSAGEPETITFNKLSNAFLTPLQKVKFS